MSTSNLSLSGYSTRDLLGLVQKQDKVKGDELAKGMYKFMKKNKQRRKSASRKDKN